MVSAPDFGSQGYGFPGSSAARDVSHVMAPLYRTFRYYHQSSQYDLNNVERDIKPKIILTIKTPRLCGQMTISKGYVCQICMQTEQARIRPHSCKGLSEPSLLVYGIKCYSILLLKNREAEALTVITSASDCKRFSLDTSANTFFFSFLSFFFFFFFFFFF